METIKFVDTTIRDGHQSLWAENMTTGMMLPIAKNLDDAGLRRHRADLRLASEEKRARFEGRPLGARAAGVENHHQDTASADRRAGQHF